MAEELDGAGLVKTALKSVPVVRYALGLAAIAILVSIARGANPDIGLAGMVPVMIGTLVLMILLIIVAAVSESRSTLAGPAVLMTWSASVALVVILAASVSAMLVGWPPQWARLILPRAAAEKPLINRERAPIAAPSPTPAPSPAPVASGTDGPARTTGAVVVRNAEEPARSDRETRPGATSTPIPIPTVGKTPSVTPFDCKKASMPLDWAICADDGAYGLNTQMIALWEAAHRDMNKTERREHVQDQLDWIYATQQQCGLPAKGKPADAVLRSSASCVRAAYSARIDAIGR